MKKVTATVIYKDNSLYNLTVIHKNAIIPLVRYSLENDTKPYKYTCFNDLYKSVFENSDVIKETIKEVLPESEIKLTIVSELLEYQKDVFQRNNLSDEVRNFYNKVNNSDISFSNGK